MITQKNMLAELFLWQRKLFEVLNNLSLATQLKGRINKQMRRRETERGWCSVLDYSEIVTETDDAWLLNRYGEGIWLPKSKCCINTTNRTILIPDCLAEKIEEKMGVFAMKCCCCLNESV